MEAWGFKSFEEMRPFYDSMCQLRDHIHNGLKTRNALSLP